MPVELRRFAEFRGAVSVSVPAATFNVAMLLDAFASKSSDGRLCVMVLVKLGALEPAPKLNVPALIWKSHGRLIGSEDELSTKVQLALAELRMTELVTVPARRLVSVPVPASVNVVAAVGRPGGDHGCRRGRQQEAVADAGSREVVGRPGDQCALPQRADGTTQT